MCQQIWYAVGEDGGIQDERWLHQYMLGKVAEKRDHDPSVFLGHFAKVKAVHGMEYFGIQFAGHFQQKSGDIREKF